MNMALHAGTPTLVALDPRSLVVCNIALYRSEVEQPAEARVTHQAYNALGCLVSQRDPRLAQPNLSTVHSLSGQVLLTDSVDAGWRLALFGEAGQVVAGWDSRGCTRRVEYDPLLRPLSLTENGQVSERLSYGGPEAFEHNQCNQPIRHDDTAGTLRWGDYGLLGSALNETRTFLQTLDKPDWPLAENERDALLEGQQMQTQWAFNGLGEVFTQTDAMGHTQHFRHTAAGQLKSVELVLTGTTQPQTLVSDIRYNAYEQVEQETAGNGVISRSVYDPQDGRLMELNAALPGGPPLQQLVYSYDPVGNIQQLEDAAQPVRFFANQRVEPVSHYRYDTLYQLIEATGREVSTGASHGPALPGLQPLPVDPNQVAHYTQHYDYDTAGNLLQLSHVGAQSFTRSMLVAPDSNRSLPEGEVDGDFNQAFDANGNLLQLVRGQALEWDARNQLQLITTVTRTAAVNDHERYIYDSEGQRCRKIGSTQTSGRMLNNEVRYLPGLELRTNADGENLHVVTVQAGRSQVRALHWQAGKPDAIDNDQLRYSLSDHLSSSTLEVDRNGTLISHESYYPFGGTSWWAARSAVEAKYKTVRYSGKERDASGLYYYGFRYYAPWLQRWINPDPAGDINGLNLFGFVGNSPVSNADRDGQFYEGKGDNIEKEIAAEKDTILFRGLSEFPVEKQTLILSELQNVRSYYTHALYMIEHHAEESADIMRSFFGPQYAEVINQVKNNWERGFSLSQEYLGSAGSGKIVGVSPHKARSLAYVFTHDPHGRIMINTQAMVNKKLAINLGHELLHLKNVSQMDTKGPKLEDYYYISTVPYLKGLTLNDTSKKNRHRITAEIITRGNLIEKSFKHSKSLKRPFAKEVYKLASIQNSKPDFDTALIEFNKNPSIVASLSARNPDSLIYAASYLHKRYRDLKLGSFSSPAKRARRQ